jgi:hypothetical protein
MSGEDVQLVSTRETLDLPEQRIDDAIRPTPVDTARNDHADLQPTRRRTVGLRRRRTQRNLPRHYHHVTRRLDRSANV